MTQCCTVSWIKDKETQPTDDDQLYKKTTTNKQLKEAKKNPLPEIWQNKTIMQGSKRENEQKKNYRVDWWRKCWTYFWYLAMMCVTILSVIPGQTSSAHRILRSSSSMAKRCSECSLCCCFNYTENNKYNCVICILKPQSGVKNCNCTLFDFLVMIFLFKCP